MNRYRAVIEAMMFLIRTLRSVRGTPCAITALAHAKEMRAEGRQVVITNASGRRLSAAELTRQAEPAVSRFGRC